MTALSNIVLVIGGPTASGKNEIALEVARKYPSEIVNADSRQIYRHLIRGTNQPSPEQQSLIPHHLFGFLEPDVAFTAADYEKKASAVIHEIAGRSKLPVVVGGTGFYLKALLKGIWPAPAKDEQLRSRFRRIAARRGKEFLHRMLKRTDPQSAAMIPPNDVYRVIRALEIYFLSGRKASGFRTDVKDRFNALKVFMDVDRSRLHESIERRTELMFQQGWPDEVQWLVRQYPGFEKMPASASLGYREIARMLQGEMDPVACKELIIRKTRQYAKRQLTWFRNQDQFAPVRTVEDVYKKMESVIELP